MGAERVAHPLTIGEMQLPDDWLEDIRDWARRKRSIQEVWLFGSRASGRAQPDSDVDLAIVLAPQTGWHDWARGNYERFGDDWQDELKSMIGRYVKLELLPTHLDIGPRTLLWKRDT